VLALVVALVPLQTATALDGDPTNTERFDVSSPTAAAIAVSQYRFAENGAGWVVVSRDDLFPDSLAGSVLTATGPLLFTNTYTLTPETRVELDRVLADGGIVYLLGSSAAIGAGPEAELVNAGYDVRRLQGPSRVETAVAVADEALRVYGGATLRVLLARAYSPDDNPTAAWADSVTGGGYAAASATPVLITPTESLHPAVDAWLDAHVANTTIVTTLLGGENALSAAVFNAVPNPVRVAGAAREDTAVAISHQLWGFGPAGVRHYTVINGYAEDGWAYGLVAGSLSATTQAPLVVIHPATVPPVTLLEVESCSAQPEVDLTVMGGVAVVPAERVAEMDAVDPRDCDGDDDGIQDTQDNCLIDFNPHQEDFNGDGQGEMCDTDIDHVYGRTLTGAEVVGGGDPDAEVVAVMSTNATDGVVCIDWVSTNGHLVMPVDAAHLHVGGVGTNGPPGITWGVLPGFTRDAACGALDPPLVRSINDNPSNFYLDVHNNEYPNGAVRAQLA